MGNRRVRAVRTVLVAVLVLWATAGDQESSSTGRAPGPVPTTPSSDSTSATAPSTTPPTVSPSVDGQASAVGWGDEVGPTVLDSLALGMSRAEAERYGATVRPAANGTGCLAVTFRTDHGTRVTGDLRPRDGLVMLRGDGAATPEKIGPGSTRALVEAAYPDATGDESLMTTPVPDYPENSYWFWFDRAGVVADVMLIRPDVRCAG